MTKQLEGLCPHNRHTGAVCLDCNLEADLYLPNKQVDWGKVCVHGRPLEDKCVICEAEAIIKEDLTAQDILHEAIDCISDRAPFRDANGEKSIELAAEVFNKLTAHDLTEYDACIFLACIKLARSQRGEFHRDDYTDACSYLALAAESRDGQLRPKGRRPAVREYLSQGSEDGWDRSESDVSE